MPEQTLLLARLRQLRREAARTLDKGARFLNGAGPLSRPHTQRSNDGTSLLALRCGRSK